MHSQEQPTSVAAVDDKARVGWGFITLHALAYTGTWLALLTPVLVTIALKVRHLAPEAAASSLSLVLGLGAFFALVGNPLFGRLSDRTTSRFRHASALVDRRSDCRRAGVVVDCDREQHRDGAHRLVSGAARIQCGAGGHHRGLARSSSRRTARHGRRRDGCLFAAGAGERHLSRAVGGHVDVAHIHGARIDLRRGRAGIRADVARSASRAGRSDIAGLARCDRDLLGESAAVSGLRLDLAESSVAACWARRF